MTNLSFSDLVRGEIDRGVLIATIDNPPVNAASIGVRQGLARALAHAADTAEVLAVVLAGAGRQFVGGADINEFGAPPVEPTLPQLVEAIETSGKPVVAAINGAAFGGGLEIALACHARIASLDARMGLPEVKLGIVPGAGGTQRLPRLIGMSAALEFIATGRTMSAAEAHSLGLVDATTDGNPTPAAAQTARELAGRPFGRTVDRPIAPFDAQALEQAAARLISRARGQQAPTEAVRLVRLAARVPLAEGLAEERAAFIGMRDSEQARALRYVFFAERAAAKIPGLEGVAPRPLAAIGVVGAGLMGTGIAVAALDAGFDVVAVDQTPERAAAGRNRVAALLDRSVAAGRMVAEGRAERLSRLRVDHRLEAVAQADLVIEAVFDDLAVKTELFSSLDRVGRPDAILATNTSYLDPERIAAATTRPERVCGMHFFSPANVMRLVEVVRCERTAPDVLATAVSVARRLGKLPIVCGTAEGFIGNRIFSAYRRAAEFLLEDGALPQDVDAAMESYGLAMGPFAVSDLAGLEIAWARRKRQAMTRDPAERYVPIADWLCEAGRFGQKSGRGWYAYPDGGRIPDPEVTALIEAWRGKKDIAGAPVEAEEIVARLLAVMAAEGRALLEEGIAARASDIDLVLINGYGFPAHKGGPMFAAGYSR